MGANDLEGQGQSTWFSKGIRRVPRCTFDVNLVIVRTSPFGAILDRFGHKWLWRSRSISMIFEMTRKGLKMHIWCKFGDPSSKRLWVFVRTSLFGAILYRFGPKWPWRSSSIDMIFERNRKCPKMHIWCKFGDPSSKRQWVIARTSSTYRRTDGRTDRRTRATTIPLGQIGRGVKTGEIRRFLH